MFAPLMSLKNLHVITNDTPALLTQMTDYDIPNVNNRSAPESKLTYEQYF